MKTPFQLSVVIPTHNRKATLERTLDALSRQVELESAFEVVVIDDASSDATAEFLRGYSRNAHPFAWSWERQEKAGQGVARNRGCERARGVRVLFLGDDILPHQRLVGEHQRAAGAAELAVLGYTAWHPEIRLTPFRRLINEDGLQFGYGLLQDGAAADYRFFYTSNLSLDRGLVLDAGGFDPEFSGYGWEDIELGYRLCRDGLRILHRRAALAYHLHAVTPASFRRRQHSSGRAALKFFLKHPEPQVAQVILLDRALEPALKRHTLEAALEPLALVLEPLFGAGLVGFLNRAMNRHFVAGLREALAEDSARRGLAPAELIHQAQTAAALHGP